MEDYTDKQISRRNFLRWATIGTLAVATPSLGRDTLEEKISKYKIGDETVQLRLLQKPGSIVTYFNMHDNENTSVQAAEEVVKKYGGRLIELKHKGTRNITFNLNGKRYEFDPNRIFTENGVKETLKERGNYSDAAFKEVKKFQDWLLQEYSLSKSKAMITVHNNYNKGFSVGSYKSGVKQKDKDPDDFFIVTNRTHYDYFANQGYNVALISSKSVKDDGSLSVYWSRVQKRPYINVEAQHGHLEQQVKMMTETIKLYKTNNKQLK